MDAFDAITSKRCYKEAKPTSVAIAELRRCSGTQFDPGVVEAFERIVPKIEALSADFEERYRAELEALGLGQVEDRSTLRARIQRTA